MSDPRRHLGGVGRSGQTYLQDATDADQSYTPSTLQGSSPSVSSSDPFTPISRHGQQAEDAPPLPPILHPSSQETPLLPLFSNKSPLRPTNRGTLDGLYTEETVSPFAPGRLPNHLRKPSLPPPSGPLPRTPSRLENEQIGALLAVPSLGVPLTFSPGSPEFGIPTHDTQNRNLYNTQAAGSRPVERLLQSHSGSGTSSLARGPSSQTQASSDALGETLESYVQPRIPVVTIPSPSQQTAAAERDASIGQVTPRPLAISPGLPENTKLAHDIDSNGKQSDGIISPLILFPRHTNPEWSDSENNLARGEEVVGRTLGRDRSSSIRIHPADDRFEHTYRVRQTTDDEEPVLVPVYNFEPPGRFPERTRLTSPRVTPGLINHTPRNFSLPRRLSRKVVRRTSSESIELLLPAHTDNSNVITIPPTAHHHHGSPRPQLAYRLSNTARQYTSQFKRNSTSKQTFDEINPSRPRAGTPREVFERQHIHYFQDLDNLEKANSPNSHVSPEIQIHGPRHSFSKRFGPPALRSADDAYIGTQIDKNRWPERYRRQGRIGKSLLFVCLLMPPFWFVMAAGFLDNFVNEMTGGEIWGVGHREKVIAGWLGGFAAFCLLVVIITAGVLVGLEANR